MIRKTAKDQYSDIPQKLRDYLNYMTVVKGRSQKTVKEYYYDLRMFLRYVWAVSNDFDLEHLEKVSLEQFDTDLLKNIDLNDLYEYMTYINNFHSSNDNYKARKVAGLRSFFNYLCVKIKFIEKDPASNLDTPKIKKRMPRYLSLNESVNFLKSIDGKNRERDLAIFILFLNCGLRLSELVGINIKDINFERKTLRVIGKGNKERMVYLNDMCLDAIQAYLAIRPTDITVQEDSNALFISSKNRRISNRMIELLSKKYFTAANIDASLYSPHKLRHTAATIMYKEGNVDIRTLQELLGHVSVSTTQIYTHIKSEDLKSAAENNPLNSIKIEKEDK